MRHAETREGNRSPWVAVMGKIDLSKNRTIEKEQLRSVVSGFSCNLNIDFLHHLTYAVLRKNFGIFESYPCLGSEQTPLFHRDPYCGKDKDPKIDLMWLFQYDGILQAPSKTTDRRVTSRIG